MYSVYGYKIHAKMLMVVRREDGQLRRYVHLGTGNCHPRTARMYRLWPDDLHEEIASDVNDIFVQITGLGRVGETQKHLLQSPFSLHSGMLAAISREAEHARAGRSAAIMPR